jgi:hypothetical protein
VAPQRKAIDSTPGILIRKKETQREAITSIGGIIRRGKRGVVDAWAQFLLDVYQINIKEVFKMEHFKIEHFERDRSGESFPKFHTLAPNELFHIRKELARKAGFDETVEPLILIRFLLDASHPVGEYNATSEGFELSSVTKELDLKPQQHIYINWDRLVTVDRMKFADLSKHFNDIWYPSADDIEVFDDSLSWILFVHHSGSVRVVQIGQSERS